MCSFCISCERSLIPYQTIGSNLSFSNYPRQPTYFSQALIFGFYSKRQLVKKAKMKSQGRPLLWGSHRRSGRQPALAFSPRVSARICLCRCSLYLGAMAKSESSLHDNGELWICHLRREESKIYKNMLKMAMFRFFGSTLFGNKQCPIPWR